MTKKELLENKVFKILPDDTELVFNTSIKGEDCCPIREENISYRKEIVGWAQKDMLLREMGTKEVEPIYRNFLVIGT